MLKDLAIAVGALLAGSGNAVAADVAAGRTLFKVCAPCHEIGEGARNKVGPILNGLDGRPAGAVADYSYSPALKYSGIVWREASFKTFIRNPSAMIYRTKMFFTGLLDPEGLEDLWHFVKQHRPDGGVSDAAEQAAVTSEARGHTIFKACAACHEIGVGARNRVGPMLNGLEGRAAGGLSDYSYSPGIRSSGIVWGKDAFKEYIRSPKAKVPGTKMGFTGLLDDEALDDLWNYLKQYGSNGSPGFSAEQAGHVRPHE